MSKKRQKTSSHNTYHNKKSFMSLKESLKLLRLYIFKKSTENSVTLSQAKIVLDTKINYKGKS